ncbi:hypothetical protein MNBD_GAMMA15-1191 [hydrothermal vent metagenome]|uniref:DUF302 domain-containing protein n=1 Tax=hydrothermal vent metagenome TaxID=652676 RepID=A0A3B0YX54_9ZZZZ
MKRIVMTVLMTLGLIAGAVASDGFIQVKSSYTVEQTLDRFEKAAKAKGMKIFTRIDHAAGAASVDKKLRPTALLIFGNPKIGTLLMQSNQAIAVDLPMKALAWRDENGQVWMGYNDPAYLVKRHGIADRDAVVEKIRKALRAFCKAATSP